MTTADPDAVARAARIRAINLNAVRAAIEDHVGRLSWTREQIDRYRTLRLRALLGHAQERSPHYARVLAGLDTERATLDDLALLPPLTKADVNERWDEIVTAPSLTRDRAERALAQESWFSYLDGEYQVFSSGGSSGVRAVYVWGRDLMFSVGPLAWRMQARFERAAEPVPTPRMAVIAAGAPPHASTPLFNTAINPAMKTVVVPASLDDDELVARVRAVDPTHIVGYASVVVRLARHTLAGDLDIGPTYVSTNSEPLPAEGREAIERAWGATIFNLWGSTEIGVQAVGCGQGPGLHLAEDEVIVERVNRNGRPVAPDEEAADTYVTGLANWTFPFIRYRLGDVMTPVPGECACGMAYARVADVEGRQDDDFRYGDTVIPAIVFRHVLGTDSGVIEYQVLQTQGGADVRVVGRLDDAGRQSLSRALAGELAQHGLRDPRVNVEAVEALERNERTAKLRRFVPLAGR
jgi:phenylacetate-CoA ligase